MKTQKVSKGFYRGTYKGVDFEIINMKPNKGYQSAMQSTWMGVIKFDSKEEKVFDATKKYVSELIQETIERAA